MSEQAGNVLLAQPVAAGQAREMRPLGGPSSNDSPFAPLSGGPGIASSQDQKLQKYVEVAAVLACVYTVGIAVMHGVGVVVAAEMIKNKLLDLEQFHSHEGFSWVVNVMPTLLMVYLVPTFVGSGVAGLLYATCGCCAARANNAKCASCFCCCSAWNACGLCFAFLTSIPTVHFLADTSGVLQARLDLCDPSVCLQNTTDDWPSNGQENSRRAVDCFAQASWHPHYHPAYPEAGYLSSSCQNPLFLHCDHDENYQEDPFECSSNPSDAVLKWQDGKATYFLTARGAPCPCKSKHILNWQECQRAFKSFPSPWNANWSSRTGRPRWGKVRACLVRETEGRGHVFGHERYCERAETRRAALVCAAASATACSENAEELRRACWDPDEALEEAEGDGVEVVSEAAAPVVSEAAAPVVSEAAAPEVGAAAPAKGRKDEAPVPERVRVDPEEGPGPDDLWMPALSETDGEIPFLNVMPPMPMEPLLSCSVNRDGVELWQLTREEAPRALFALQAMNVVRIVLIIPGVVIFGLAFWWGQLLWKRVSQPAAPIQQPLLPTMVWPHELQPVQEPLVVAGGPHPGNGPAVAGNGGV